MQFYDVIRNRTSVKKFKGDEISEEKLDNIINAAMMSPSWKNKTSYKFILVDDNAKKSMIADCIINETQDAAESVRQAPMTAVIVADPSVSGKLAGREYYLVDSAIAMEHFILAATEEGYGTCWIASVDEELIRQALSIPNNFRVVGLTPIGISSETKPHNPEKDIKEHVYLNSWNEVYSENKHKIMS